MYDRNMEYTTKKSIKTTTPPVHESENAILIQISKYLSTLHV